MNKRSDHSLGIMKDLGGNAVHAYTAHKENGTLSPLQDVSPAEAGSGPRHAVIPPSQEYFYVIEEEALLVQQFGLDKSTGKLNATGNSLPVTPFGSFTIPNLSSLLTRNFVRRLTPRQCHCILGRRSRSLLLRFCSLLFHTSKKWLF